MMTRAAIVIPRTKWRKPQRRLSKVSQMLALRLPRERAGFYLKEIPESACEGASAEMRRRKNMSFERDRPIRRTMVFAEGKAASR